MNFLQPLQPFVSYLWIFAVIAAAGISAKITANIKESEIVSLQAEITLLEEKFKAADEFARKEQARFDQALQSTVSEYSQQLSQIQKEKEDSDKAWLKSTLEVSKEIVQTKNEAKAAEDRIRILTEQLKSDTSGGKEVLTKWLEEAKANSKMLAEKLDSLECLGRQVPAPTLQAINQILGAKP